MPHHRKVPWFTFHVSTGGRAQAVGMSDKDKSMFENIADAAKAGVDSLADRARAVGHDIAAKVGDEAGNARDRAEAEAARARAASHGAEYRREMDAANNDLVSGLGQAKAKADQAAADVKDKAHEAAQDVKADVKAVEREADRQS